MQADGLTKLLTTQSHKAFVEALGLVNIQHLVMEQLA